jgi:hypothetical protein
VKRALLFVAALAVASSTARADDDVEPGVVIFARGGALYRVDSRGRGEKELAKLPDPKAPVRALRSDARGSVLLANVGGAWLWMPLDGSATALTELTACEAGPAQLADDGACVLCKSGDGFAIVNLATGKTFHPKDSAPHPFVVGTDAERRLVFADADGIWSAPMTDFTKKQQLAPAAPLRGFLPSSDGTRAVGVYSDTVYTDARHTKQADVLETFQLDGTAARRKAIKDGVALEWSHDATWLLVQDGAKACIMRAIGGQYKCWNGFTAASLAPDGRFALVLGNRDKAKKPEKRGEAKIHGAPPKDDDDAQPVEPDVAVAPPTGPLSLYRARLEGAYTDPPVVIVKVVDGAAVWVPSSKANP